jgi:hypothetical protein
MGLGNRTGHRHETIAAAKVSARSEDYWDFQPGQRVMTVDGFPGKVTAVNDGPVMGVESYLVTLDNEMGHGEYSPTQLRPANETTASSVHTAAEDYPELREILAERPDIAINTVLGSRTAADRGDYGDYSDDYEQCPNGDCREMVNTNHESLSDHVRREHGTFESTATKQAGSYWGEDPSDDYSLPSSDSDPIKAWSCQHCGTRNPEWASECNNCDRCSDCGEQLPRSDSPEEDFRARQPHRRAHQDEPYHFGSTHATTNTVASNPYGIETFPGQEPNDGADSGVDEHGHLTWGGASPGCRDTDEYSMFGQNDAAEKTASWMSDPHHATDPLSTNH